MDKKILKAGAVNITNAREFGFHPYIFRIMRWDYYYPVFLVLKLIGIYKISPAEALKTICKGISNLGCNNSGHNRLQMCKRIAGNLNFDIDWENFNVRGIPYRGYKLKLRKTQSNWVKEEVKRYKLEIQVETHKFTEEQKERQKERARKTSLERYGDEKYNNPEKAAKTRAENDKSGKSREAFEKARKTCRERYGVDYYTQTQEARKACSERAKKICENRWKGIDGSQSMAECAFFDKLEGNVIKPGLIQYQERIGKFIVDGLIPHKKFVFEFLGDYWHGNPDIFPPWEINKSCRDTHGNLYKKTFERFQKIEDMGYKVFYIWENDFNLYGVDALKSFSEPHLLEDSLNG